MDDRRVGVQLPVCVEMFSSTPTLWSTMPPSSLFPAVKQFGRVAAYSYIHTLPKFMKGWSFTCFAT
jgi:hypothetical protein